MQVSERNIDDITVIDLSGHLIYEEGFEALRETFNRLIGQGRTRLLLNMAQVSSLDSSGVGLIVRS